MGSSFDFKQFSIRQERSALKVGTDAVVLGAAMTLLGSERRLLDIGTGTGVIALMAAQRLSGRADFHITGIDIDGPSAAEAAANFAASPWPSALEARGIPLQEYIPDGEIDLVFSNPPFYDDSLRNPDPRESTARHTESLSFRDICAFCAENLTPEGRLSLILPCDCRVLLVRTAASFGLHPFRLLTIRTTAAKAPRRLVAEFSRRRTEQPREDSLILQDGASRTPEYAALTEDFYLY